MSGNPYDIEVEKLESIGLAKNLFGYTSSGSQKRNRGGGKILLRLSRERDKAPPWSRPWARDQFALYLRRRCLKYQSIFSSDPKPWVRHGNK
ncbi:hypothetical protein TNCV_4927271 [Trichonephila clavipes]|nr:hypothetical protein TNCV_4927271 [Trichonephila clavipes]